VEDRMSKNRILNLQKEYSLLEFCFSASLILFKEI
jgi:hypothetical protein